MPPRLLLADDHPLVMQALRRLVEPFAQIVGVACDGSELMAKATALRPDAIILDVNMPVIDGIAAAERLRPILREVRFAFWTMTEEPDGARLAALQPAIWLGKNLPSAELATAFANWLSGSAEPASPGPTPRQLQVLRLLAEGCAMKQVAKRLELSVRTVAFHKYRAMRLLALESTADIVRYVLHHQALSEIAADTG
jgi:DNA-binding NarL/FixJ family response regulator